MTKGRKRHSAEFKAKVALEAAKEVKTLNELASEYGVHPAQIAQWKRELLDGIPGFFGKNNKPVDRSKEVDDLYRQIGQLTMECGWLKKKLQRFP